MPKLTDRQKELIETNYEDIKRLIAKAYWPKLQKMGVQDISTVLSYLPEAASYFNEDKGLRFPFWAATKCYYEFLDNLIGVDVFSEIKRANLKLGDGRSPKNIQLEWSSLNPRAYSRKPLRKINRIDPVDHFSKIDEQDWIDNIVEDANRRFQNDKVKREVIVNYIVPMLRNEGETTLHQIATQNNCSVYKVFYSLRGDDVKEFLRRKYEESR